MNKERIQGLIDHLRTLDPSKFQMSTWIWEGLVAQATHNECGSPACMCGHAIAIHDPRTFKYMSVAERVGDPSVGQWYEKGAEILGLEESTALELFAPNITSFDNQTFYCSVFMLWPDGWYKEITIEKAILVLEHLLDTGKVVYDVAFKDEIAAWSGEGKESNHAH